MADNTSSISKIAPARGKRLGASTPAPTPGKRASVKLAPPPSEPDSAPVEGNAGDAPPAPVARPRRGPKPGSKRTPREPKVKQEGGAFDASSVSKGLKTQLKQLKAARVEESKQYKAESKRLQSELSKLSAQLEKLENAHIKAAGGFEAGIAKITAVLDSLA